MNTSPVTLRPQIIYWLFNNLFLIAFGLLILSASLYFKSSFQPLIYMGLIVFFFTIILSFYKYIEIRYCTKWVITEEQIKIYKGVFLRSVNYIELYRIFDYEEKKSFIQLLLKNTNIIVRSGDKSSPILVIFGIKAGTGIVDLIRERVEIQKQKKSIYEITNRI